MKRGLWSLIDNTYYGEVGLTSPYKIGNINLETGDVVHLYDVGYDGGNRFVVYENNKFFIMGIEVDCNDSKGIITNDWTITLVKKFTEVEDNEIVDSLQCKVLL